MKTTRNVVIFGTATFITFTFGPGCSADNGNSTTATGRGTPACHDWQSGFCGWLSRCQGPAAACDQVKGVSCKSDAEAQRCASAFASATCSSPPANCASTDLADPAPAGKACEDFGTTLCQRSEECQPGTHDTCLQDFKNALDCSKAIGFTLSYEACLMSIPAIACTNLVPPPVCTGVLVVTK